MARWFELWDAENASLVGTYGTQEAALAVVRRSRAQFGDEAIRSLVLTDEEGGDADPRVIAIGLDLADLAQGAGTTPAVGALSRATRD